jgi:LuxR family maltose regulon positive regulatory protein
MIGRQDVKGFIQQFAGDNRVVIEFLTTEVLQRQPGHVRDFLLQTSILDKLNASLCNAVANRDDSTQILNSLYEKNLFLFAVDDKSYWYRYHQLFADALQSIRKSEKPGVDSDLHHRASVWYEQNQLPAEAVSHSVSAGNFNRAAELLELHARELLSIRKDERFLSLMKSIPDEFIQNRPVLCIYYALALLPGNMDEVKRLAHNAQMLLQEMQSSKKSEKSRTGNVVVVNYEEFKSLPGILSVLLAYLAGAQSDIEGVLMNSRNALKQLPESDYIWRGGASALLGFASWAKGDLEGACTSYQNGVRILLRTGDYSNEIGAAFILAQIRNEQGRLHEAKKIIDK